MSYDLLPFVGLLSCEGLCQLTAMNNTKCISMEHAKHKEVFQISMFAYLFVMNIFANSQHLRNLKLKRPNKECYLAFHLAKLNMLFCDVSIG